MKYNISPSASTSQTDLSRTIASTLDFNQILPVNFTDCIIGDKHNVHIDSYFRLAPMVNPTFGNMQVRFVSFFVPYYQVMPHFDDFVSGLSSYAGTNLSIPSCYITHFAGIFNVSTGLSTVTGTESDYDFQAYSSVSGTTDYHKFTSDGRYVYKILQSLGYSISAGQTSSPYNNQTGYPTKLSLLPILCFLKAYNDWMSVSPLYNSSAITAFLEQVRNGYSFTTHANLAALGNILKLVRPLIGSDYFTSAYNYSYQPGPVISNSISNRIQYNQTNSDTSSFNSASVITSGNNTITTTLTSNNTLNSRQLNFLQSFDKWIRLNNLSGTKAAQRIYNRFGLKSEDFRSNYAHLIHSTKTPLQVSDVVSTTRNDNVSLGDYAGQSVAQASIDFDYECMDYGALITLAFIDVRAAYYNSIAPHVLRNSSFDFYQPEFDGVGMEPISSVQLQNYPELISEGLNPASSVFGFVPRYEDYRTSYDLVTGDFIRFKNMMSWHFGRDLSSNQRNGTPNVQPQSNDFQFIGDELDRIFQSDTSNVLDDMADHFFCVFRCNHSAVRKIKSRANSIQMSDGSISAPSFGNNIQSV